MPIAFNNLAVAQHRDMLRYTKTRSGTFEPKLQRFVAGDFVYLKRQKADSLDPRVGRLVLRVKSVGSGGRLVLEGRDRKTDQGPRRELCSLPPPQPRSVAEPEAGAWRRGPWLSGVPLDHWRLDNAFMRWLRRRLAQGVLRSAAPGNACRGLVLP